MFLEAISKFGSSTINLPLAQLVDSGTNIFSTVGIAIPAVSVSQLGQIGLFDYVVAEKISKSLFESAGKTITGHWMDCTGSYQNFYPQGVPVGWHRIRNHHFLTDAFKAYQNPDLNLIDFYKHLGTDFVTKRGLPILPEGVVLTLANFLGTTPAKIMPWVSFNILDTGASIFAVAHSGSNITSVISGSAKWGLGYAVNTFGVGTLEIAAGFQTTNPILIGSGAVDVACGTITAYKYYNQPFFCGVPVSNILQSAAVGASFASILGLAEILLSQHQTTTTEKAKLLAERIGTSTVLSAMSAISVPLSVTTSFALVGFSLAKKAAEDSNEVVRAIPIQAGLAHEIDQFIANKYIGSETMQRMMNYLEPNQENISDSEKNMLSFLE